MHTYGFQVLSMSPNKEETAIHSCHCPGGMAVRILYVYCGGMALRLLCPYCGGMAVRIPCAYCGGMAVRILCAYCGGMAVCMRYCRLYCLNVSLVIFVCCTIIGINYVGPPKEKSCGIIRQC